MEYAPQYVNQSYLAKVVDSFIPWEVDMAVIALYQTKHDGGIGKD